MTCDRYNILKPNLSFLPKYAEINKRLKENSGISFNDPTFLKHELALRSTKAYHNFKILLLLLLG